MSDRDCETILQLIPAYSIGATTAEEAALVEAQLPDCPEAVDALADYMLLSDAMEQALKPADRRTRGAPSRRPAAARPRPRSRTTASRRTTPRLVWISAAVAVLSLVLLGGVSLYWLDTVSRLRQQQQELLARLEAQEERESSALVLAGDVRYRHLSATADGSPESRATVIWDPEAAIGAIYVSGLQPLDQQHRYSAWLVRDGEVQHLGQFQVDSQGSGMLLFQHDIPLEEYDAIGINVEPASGSAEPTTPHLVIGEL